MKEEPSEKRMPSPNEEGGSTPSPEADPAAARREAKRARKKFRREIAHRMRRVVIRRVGLMVTNPQLKSMTRTLTDRYMHQVDHVPTKVVPHGELHQGSD